VYTRHKEIGLNDYLLLFNHITFVSTNTPHCEKVGL
jgi:hypothetical protein